MWLFKCLTNGYEIVWAVSSEEVPSSMRKMHRSRSPCAYAIYYPDLCFPFIHSIVSNDSVSGQWMPWSDWVDAQAYLGLRWSYMPENTFSYGAPSSVWLFFFLVFATKIQNCKKICISLFFRPCTESLYTQNTTTYSELWRDIRCNIVSGNIFVPYLNMYSILRYLCPIKYIYMLNRYLLAIKYIYWQWKIFICKINIHWQ